MGTELLGKQVDYPNIYSPALLEGITRQTLREDIGITENALPFHGVDFWNAYEFSWLDAGSKPVVAMLELMVPTMSPKIVESKSLKLYLGSFNMTSFKSTSEVVQTLESDLSMLVQAPVVAKVSALRLKERTIVSDFKGDLLDQLEVRMKHFELNTSYLKEPARVGLVESLTETLYTHLFRSLCPVTGQPDWATVVVRYCGQPISHHGLLKYLLSYRHHSGFHEHCIEKIYQDIMNAKHPEHLTVIGYFTRRGGIEINPFRSNFESADNQNLRMIRQ